MTKIIECFKFRRVNYMKTMTLRMPDDLHRALKVRMAQLDRTMQNQIIELIEEYLEQEEDQVTAPRCRYSGVS